MGKADISVTLAGKALGRRRPAADEVFGEVDSSGDDLISGKGQNIQIAPSTRGQFWWLTFDTRVRVSPMAGSIVFRHPRPSE
jgi:hypothetical protein